MSTESTQSIPATATAKPAVQGTQVIAAVPKAAATSVLKPSSPALPLPPWIAKAQRTTAQKASSTLDKIIDDHAKATATAQQKALNLLDGTKASDGTTLTREAILAESGERRASVQAYLTRLALPARTVPPATTTQPAAEKAA